MHRAVKDEFVARVAALAAEHAVLGDPFAAETTLGPLNNEPVAVKMDEHVADAIERGATVVAGGARASGFPTSLYWPATILDGVPADSLVAREETFGPIAPVVQIDSLDEAIELTNASPYGLLAAIFTRDLARGLRFADEVRTGWVNVNESTNYWESHLPFGGRAGSASGTGRVGGSAPMESFTELQTVVLHRLTYDFLVVGGGSAGCVLANRLSADPSTQVLVLEAGRPDSWWDLYIHMPAALAFPIGNRFYDWKYESEPEPFMHDRRIYHARGKVLGGSSSINGMIFQRGNALDYERWAAGDGHGAVGLRALPAVLQADGDLPTRAPTSTAAATGRCRSSAGRRRRRSSTRSSRRCRRPATRSRTT